MILLDQKPLNIPQYCYIRENLRTLIKQGKLKPGDPILSEKELCKQFGVSRMTVRQAISNLVDEKLLYRKQGKGTFVKELKIEPDISKLTSFTEDMLSRGIVPSAKTIYQKLGSLPPDVVRRWKLPKDEKITITKRLLFADGEPVGVNISHVPFYLCPGLIEENLEKNSIKSVLSSKYGLIFSVAKQTIEISCARKNDARLLNILPKDPVFLVERVTYLEDGRFLDFTLNIFRGDKYKFYINIRS